MDLDLFGCELQVGEIENEVGSVCGLKWSLDVKENEDETMVKIGYGMFAALGISLVMENGVDGWFYEWGSKFDECEGWLGRKDEENYDGHDDCTRTVMCAR
ncbi:hypothetical protein DEO72_LG3g336 [Vigna unguiculata]|uniref:Uncharacterized protein n=1 Tax=Vigna unguiculata TaxID=3917 RepID=A0A4D6LBS1_VIGUN|nr:hypothetical protein DEO72_LG3g335 [Vigna unguiculata]QCD85815.1 hypothetical protein DEO72_LG3g336 [Vigna unguiculata]